MSQFSPPKELANSERERAKKGGKTVSAAAPEMHFTSHSSTRLHDGGFGVSIGYDVAAKLCGLFSPPIYLIS